MNIDKGYFAVKMANKTNFEVKQTKMFLDVILEIIEEELIKGNKVKLVNFGEFVVKDRMAKKWFNPHNGEIMDIPACKEPVFVVGKQFKELIKNL